MLWIGLRYFNFGIISKVVVQKIHPSQIESLVPSLVFPCFVLQFYEVFCCFQAFQIYNLFLQAWWEARIFPKWNVLDFDGVCVFSTIMLCCVYVCGNDRCKCFDVVAHDIIF